MLSILIYKQYSTPKEKFLKNKQIHEHGKEYTKQLKQ